MAIVVFNHTVLGMVKLEMEVAEFHEASFVDRGITPGGGCTLRGRWVILQGELQPQNERKIRIEKSMLGTRAETGWRPFVIPIR